MDRKSLACVFGALSGLTGCDHTLPFEQQVEVRLLIFDEGQAVRVHNALQCEGSYAEGAVDETGVVRIPRHARRGEWAVVLETISLCVYGGGRWMVGWQGTVDPADVQHFTCFGAAAYPMFECEPVEYDPY